MSNIFISYRRSDSASMCGRIYDQLCTHFGKSNVFKDVYDIPPGVHFKLYIENFIKASNVELVIIGSRWLNILNKKSRLPGLKAAIDFVIFEIETALHNGIPLIPVLVEEAQMQLPRMPLYEDLPFSIRELANLQAIVIRHDPDFEKDISRLINTLALYLHPTVSKDAPTTSLNRYSSPVDQVSEMSTFCTISGIKEVLQWGWNGVKLLDEFISLDYETLDELSANAEGDSKQWAPIFMNHPDTWRMLISAPQKIVGYWHFAPLFPNDYNLAKIGSLHDSEITVDRVRFFEFPGIYEVYFVQVCLLPQYRTTHNVRLLFESIFSVLNALSIEGIFISEVCANAYTTVGHSLCKTFQLKYLCQHVEHGDIYAASIKDIFRHSFVEGFEEMRTRYIEAGLN